MKKILASLLILFVAQVVFAESYGGVGVGASEACRTKYEASFFGGDCISPNIDFHGLIGNQVNEYFSIEGSVDFSFDAGNLVEIILGGDKEDSFFYDSDVESNRWSILTLAVHPLVHLPISNSFSIFAGPSFGGSMVNFDYDVKYFGNDSLSQNSHSATEFGLNYGWTAGVNIKNSSSSAIRLQWQNWRSLDADVSANPEFNSNTFTVSMISYF
jgi:hypothetical protein